MLLWVKCEGQRPICLECDAENIVVEWFSALICDEQRRRNLRVGVESIFTSNDEVASLSDWTGSLLVAGYGSVADNPIRFTQTEEAAPQPARVERLIDLAESLLSRS